MIVFQVETSTSSENRMELLQTLQTLVEPIRAEEGCEGVLIMKDLINDSRYIISEKWQAQGDLDVHLRSEHFSVLLGALNCLCEPGQLEFCTFSLIRREGDANHLF